MSGGRRARRVAGATLLAAAVLLSGAPAGAQRLPAGSLFPPDVAAGLALGGPVTLTADTLSYDGEAGVAVAEGNVEVGFGNRTIRADRIRYDARTGQAEFSGRVHYDEAGDAFSFDRVEMNVRTELGVLHNGTIRLSTNNYRISSERFEKTGGRTFFIRKGTLTTCPCDGEPDWKFRVGRSNVTLDGYAVGTGITFDIKGVPVFWLPWAAFPVKLTRQSGLLLPSFSKSASKGTSVSLPYYWAVSRWSDATLTMEAMTRRGFRPEAEFRYVLNPSSEGAARASAYRDRVTEDTRYRAYGENVLRIGEGFTANARWDVTSDARYHEDLVDEEILRTARHVTSRAFGARHGAHGSHALAAVWVQDNQGTPDDNTLQRLPEYSFTLLPRELGNSGIEAGGELSGAYFHREQGEREVRGRGAAVLSRAFALYPSVSLVPFLSVDLYEAVPVAERGGTERAGRVIPMGGAAFQMDLRRDFPSAGARRFVHLVSPAAAFRWIPEVNQADIPLNDHWSRVGAQSEFTFSVTQRLLRPSEAGPVEVAFLELAWAIDARERAPSASPYVDPYSPYLRALRDQIDLATTPGVRSTEAASDIYARLHVVPSPGWRLSGETLFDPNVGDVTVAAASAEYRRGDAGVALLEYRRSGNLAEDLHGMFGVRPLRFLGLQGSGDYSMTRGELTEGWGTVTLHPRSDCWSVGFTVGRKTRPEETSFKLTFSLLGIGTIGK